LEDIKEGFMNAGYFKLLEAINAMRTPASVKVNEGKEKSSQKNKSLAPQISEEKKLLLAI
jgi:hypothetical protein